MGTTDLHLPVALDKELQERDKRYWEQATKMVVRPNTQDQTGVRALVEQLAPDYGVSPQLAAAVAETESNFNPRAQSRAGAKGVMQLMDGTAAQYNVGDIWNPEDNIRGGLKYLAKLQQQFPGRVDLQLAAYNAGEGAVAKHGNQIPPYPETQEYVARVQARLSGQPYTSKQAGTGAPGVTPPEAAGPEAPPEWTPARRPIEPPLEEPLGQRLGPRLATGALTGIEAGLKGVEPLEKSLGLSTGLGALATATAQDLQEYVTSKIAPTGTEHTPLDTTAEALGQALPFFIPGMATEAMVGRLAMVAPKVATAIGYTTSGVLQGITAAGGTYDALKGVLGEEEAAKRASHAFATNTLLGTVGSALGVFNRVVPTRLSRAVVGAVSQGVQGAIQYDVQRGEFWVPAEHPSAEALLAQGWEAQGGRVVQPYKFKDQLEAGLVQAVVGGVLGGMQELSHLPLPAKLQEMAQEPGFTVQRALEAAAVPELPPADVPLATWQKWGQAVLDLLPEANRGTLARAILSNERGSTGGTRQPTLQAGAEGLSPENYRTEAGQWRIPLRDMPSKELEIQDFIRQQGKINLANETDVPGELRALISPAEVGRELSLQNDRTGLSLQEMAERAAEQGFTATADKESLLHALDRTITQGHNVYSQYATGHVPLVDSPHVEAAYQHTLEAIQTLEGRITEQTRGVRPHAEVFAEAQRMLESGGWTIDDVREIMPGTALDDTTLGQVMLSVSKIAEQLQAAAQRVVETGGHPGSSEVMDYLTIKAMLAEVIPMQRGVVAEAGRTLSFLNDPVSPHTRYLNELTAITQKQGAGGKSALAMARMDVAISTPAERIARDPAGPQRLAEWAQVKTSLGDWYQGYLGDLQEQRLLQSPEEQATAATEARLKASLEDWWARNMSTPYQGELQQQVLLLSTEETMAAWRKGRATFDLEQWFQEHGVPFMPRLDPGAGTGQALLFNPADYPEEQTKATLALAQANLGMARPGFAEMMTEQYTAAKMGPRSWTKNAVGNTALGIYAFPVRLMAEGISQVRQRVEVARGQTPDPGVVPGETAAMFWGLTHGTREHFKNAAENWRTGESKFGAQGTGKTDVYPKAVTAENVAALTGIDPTGPTARVLDFWAEYIGYFSGGRTSHRILNTTDELYKSWNFNIQQAALAHAEAARLGLDGLPMVDQIATIMADPTLAARVNEGALDFSIQQTLQQQLPQEGIGSFFTKIAQKSFHIPYTDQNFPWGRLLLPFIKIPVNGARFIVDNSVLALTQQKFYAALHEGGRKADIALAQVVIGSLAMGAMAGLVGSGACVGRAPTDPVQRDVFLKEHPEYSCRLGIGPWVPYDFFDPIAGSLKMIADVAQLMGELKGDQAAKITAALFFGIYKDLWSSTAAKSLSDFFGAVQPGRGDESANQILSNMQRFARQQIPSMVSSTGLRAAAMMMDPEKKAIGSMIDALYAQFPWGSNMVPRDRSINGEPNLFGDGIGPEMLRPLVRAFAPGRWQDSDLGPAGRAIRDNDMLLRKPPALLDREAMPVPGEAALTAEEMASLKGIPSSVLTPVEHEHLQVISALNEEQARTVFPWGPGDPPLIPPKAVRLATKRVAMGLAHTAAPKDEMTLGEMLDWLTTTPIWDDLQGGRGGGKEDLFRNAIAVYHEIGKQVFLHMHPVLAEKHVQTGIEHTIRKLPISQQGPRRLTEEKRVRMRAQIERKYLGFDEDEPADARPTVGAP